MRKMNIHVKSASLKPTVTSYWKNTLTKTMLSGIVSTVTFREVTGKLSRNTK